MHAYKLPGSFARIDHRAQRPNHIEDPGDALPQHLTNENAELAPLPSSPALGRYAKGLPGAVILLQRNRTDRPLQ